MAEKMITSSRSAVFAAGLLCLLRQVRQVCFVYCCKVSCLFHVNSMPISNMYILCKQTEKNLSASIIFLLVLHKINRFFAYSFDPLSVIIE